MFSDDEGDGPPALPVGGVVSEDEMRRRIAAGPPTSAEDYLQRVRCVRDLDRQGHADQRCVAQLGVSENAQGV